MKPSETTTANTADTTIIDGRAEDNMHQLALDWTTSTKHGTHTRKLDLPKEEHLLRHLYQGGRPYCALYALAILEELDIEHVIKTAKQTTARILKRSRYTGTFFQIRATYKALGYTFPFNVAGKGARRIKNLKPERFKGKGYARLTKRKKSNAGHQVCYQDGIVYDSGRKKPQTAEQFLKKEDKYTWIVIRKRK